jgi:hypothetical protein
MKKISYKFELAPGNKGKIVALTDSIGHGMEKESNVLAMSVIICSAAQKKKQICAVLVMRKTVPRTPVDIDIFAQA